MSNCSNNIMKEITKKITKFFSALADETRVQILLELKDKPKTVSQIHESFNDSITISAISHQLRMLYDNDIIELKKKGRERIYGLSQKYCWCILKDAKNHFDEKTCKSCMKNYEW
jgi:ArsR family transcriptional regulator, lead/cadmium/zinc/bismuth-responsive transcriptional repressor